MAPERKTPNKGGRPPAGVRDGERVTDYPQLSVHVPDELRLRLQALAQVTGQPQWRVLAAAVDTYIERLGEDERKLIGAMLERAEPLLTMPSKTAKTPVQATILNVDDNDSMRFARSTMLRQEGFDVVEAETGRQAIQVAARHVPNLVLLDVHLPDISGLDVCRQIKADPVLKHVKVIQLSATFSSPHDQLYGLETGGADIYLAEPVQRGTLLSVIRRLLAKPA
jgi:CheY-like chemotaxis protein/predicted DNA-binding protein